MLQVLACIVKHKTPPKAKFLLPAEPECRTIVLLSELKDQESSDADWLAPSTKQLTSCTLDDVKNRWARNRFTSRHNKKFV